jgi:hypothetical protein
MNRNDDMEHVKNSADLRAQLREGQPPSGVFGDSIGGKSFTDQESAILEAWSRQLRSVGAGWHEMWAGPGTTCWTIIDCRPNTAEDAILYQEALGSR